MSMKCRSTYLSALLVAGGLTLLSVVHFLIAFDTLRRSTPTVDEVAHLPAGLSYLEKRTFKMYPHNPPLSRMATAAAALRHKPKTHYQGTWARHNPPNHWLFAFEFLLVNSENAQLQKAYLDAFTSARIVVAVLSAATIPVLFFWGRWWFGSAAGWLAAVLWTLSPNVIAHAGFVTTDLAAASAGCIASFAFALWLEGDRRILAFVAGVALGAAQLVKFSSLLLYIIFTAWLIGYLILARFRPDATFNADRSSILRRCVDYAILLTVSVLVINLGYLFEGSFRPIGNYQFISETLTRPRTPADPRPKPTSSSVFNYMSQHRINRFHGTLLGKIPAPLPYHYLRGFDDQKFEAEGKYQMYLRGTFASEDPAGRGPTGWRYYYVYAMAIKLPISTLALFGVAICRKLWLFKRRKVSEDEDVQSFRWSVMFCLFAAPLAGMSLLTDINIGLRYTLVVFPFLFLLCGTSVRPGDGRLWKTIAIFAVVWNVGSLYRIHPHELSYFNELVGGPKNGRLHLIDSNIDWGQDLRALSRWLEENPDWKDAKIAYFGSVPPEFEGIEDYRLAPRMLPKEEADRLPWETVNDPTTYGPQPGKFIISVNFERGMFFHTPFPLRRLQELATLKPDAFKPSPPMIYNEKDAYSYFQKYEPHIVEEVGYSLLFFDISLEEANRVRKELGLPPTRPE